MPAADPAVDALTRTRYADALRDVLGWAAARDYSGYSKFDALNSPFLTAACCGIGPLKWAVTQAVYRSPVNVRPLLGVRKGRNPKGIGLFALAYLLRARVLPDEADKSVAEARALLDWLSEHRSAGYSGACWGYNHPWPNFRFSVPAYSPNLVVTGNVVIAFLHAYEQLGDPRYLEIARDSLEFVLNDLTTVVDSADHRAISYVPGSRWIVLNNQGLAAVLFAWVAKHTGEDHLRELARRHIAFLAAQQTDYGAWYYAYPPNSSPVTHDNYHTGNVLDWLLLYSVLTGDNTFLPQFESGLEFYGDQLFLPSGAPKHRHNVRYPHDVHGAAQGAITFCRAAIYGYPESLENARRCVDWSLDKLRAPDGHFYYQQTRIGINRTPLMRWNQGWMSVALAHLLLANDHVAGRRPALPGVGGR